MFCCSNCNVGSAGKNSPTFDDLTPSEFTPEMEAVMKRKAEREAAERQIQVSLSCKCAYWSITYAGRSKNT